MKLISIERLTWKKLALYQFLPLVSVSVIISLIYIFFVENSAYLNVGVYLNHNYLISSLIELFFYFMDSALYLSILIVFCSLIIFIISEILLITKILLLKKSEQSGYKKLIVRFLGVQLISLSSLVISFFSISIISIIIASTVGLIDLNSSVKSAKLDAISENQKIIENIRQSRAKIDIYDSSNEFGLVLSNRDLQKRKELSIYSGIILPIIAKIYKTDIAENFYMPSTNSVVYTNFTKNKSDQILSELAINHVKNTDSDAIRASFRDKNSPTIIFIEDDQYAPLMMLKLKELNRDNLNNTREIIKSNEIILNQCIATEKSNERLVIDQEADYEKNCVKSVNYNDCKEFRKKIDENLAISKTTSNTCINNRNLLNSQYAEVGNLEKSFNEKENSTLEMQKQNLSTGMYFEDIKTIYMRIIANQDPFDYVRVILHELMHHYSTTVNMPTFINEGITELYTYRSLNYDNYEIAKTAFYYKEVQIIMALLEKIPEEELLTLYTGKNKTTFENLFKKYFPLTDYKKFIAMGDEIFKESYNASENAKKSGYFETKPDNSSVMEIRTFLGLDKNKFYK